MGAERLREHYDTKHPREFPADQPPIRLVPYPSNRIEAALSIMAAHVNGGSVLEIGSGEGILARSMISNNIPFSSFTVTDLSESRAQAAASAIDDERVNALALDVEGDTGTLGDTRYDAIVLIAVIEHLIDPIRAMRTLRGLLKPGGFVYIDTPNIAKYTRRIKLLFGRFPSTASADEGLSTYTGGDVDLHDEGHLHYFTFRSLERMLLRYCGFTSVERTPYWYSNSGASNRLTHGAARAFPGLFAETTVLAR